MSKILKKFLIGIISMALYILLFWLLNLILDCLPDQELWGKIDFEISPLSFSLNFFSFISFIIGLIIFCYGVLRLSGISEQNHKARDSKTRKPVKLLTEGYYGEVRHPMYGTFMLIQLGLFLSLRSLLATIVIALFIITQYANGIFEEKRELAKIFGEEYELYRRKVKSKYLTGLMKIIFGLAGILTIPGIIFMK